MGFCARFLLFVGVGTSAFWGARLHAQADYDRFFDEDQIPQVEQWLRDGRIKYAKSVISEAKRRGQKAWQWDVYEARVDAKWGRYPEALNKLQLISEREDLSLAALLSVQDFLLELGDRQRAAALTVRLNDAAKTAMEEPKTSATLTVLGQAALRLGADAEDVLSRYYRPATEIAETENPASTRGLVTAHMAIGQLAMRKDDFQLAAEAFADALSFDPYHTEARLSLIEAILSSDRGRAAESLKALIKDAREAVGPRLLQAELHLQREAYDEAEKELKFVERINPNHPEALALQAVLAELRDGDSSRFGSLRQKAREALPLPHPKALHRMGRILTLTYRHYLGAECQQEALKIWDDYAPAQLQLALDFLRLGQMEKAWPLAAAVADANPYHVQAYNLLRLQERIGEYARVEKGDFILLLPREEAELYGERAIELLGQAQAFALEHYGFRPDVPTLIEFYPEQQDFAVRTFGSLGGQGYLGVCFGPSITMNSPGNLTSKHTNWEATLWHEYFHTVTLALTRYRMPRWLSEGISVMEETARDERWGFQMQPEFRKRITNGKLYPVEEMSRAFFEAESGSDIGFAYFQSKLVVEKLIKDHGREGMRKILLALGEGGSVAEALKSEVGIDLKSWNKAFQKEARAKAKAYGSEVDWSEWPASVDPTDIASVDTFLERRPNHWEVRRFRLQKSMRERRWEDALVDADRLIDLLPEFVQRGNAYRMKSTALDELGREDDKLAVLGDLASRSHVAVEAFQELIEQRKKAENWQGVLTLANDSFAVRPGLAQVLVARGRAHAAIGQKPQAISDFEKAIDQGAMRAHLIHFQLFDLKRGDQMKEAKRHLLDAIALVPTYEPALSALASLP